MVNSQGDSNVPDVERLIEQASKSGYQQITLPDGRVIPGEDRLPTANLIYPDDLTGRSVLDVGCYYGFFLHEAVRRHATRAVGIEMDSEHYAIAASLAPLWHGKVAVHHGMLEHIDLDEQFDVVLFLNVLHHVNDPVAVMKKLASLCHGTLVVEFRQPHDPQFVQEGLHGPSELTDGRDRPTGSRRVARRARRGLEAGLMELVTKCLPVIGVGAVEYHRSFFFSQAAFQNTFMIHNRLFKSVEFRPSVRRGQVLAFCDCSVDN